MLYSSQLSDYSKNITTSVVVINIIWAKAYIYILLFIVVSRRAVVTSVSCVLELLNLMEGNSG